MQPLIHIPYEKIIMTVYGTFKQPLFLVSDIATALGRFNIIETVESCGELDKKQIEIATNHRLVAKITIVLTAHGVTKLSADYPGPITNKFIHWVWTNVVKPLEMMVAKDSPQIQISHGINGITLPTDEAQDAKIVDIPLRADIILAINFGRQLALLEQEAGRK